MMMIHCKRESNTLHTLTVYIHLFTTIFKLVRAATLFHNTRCGLNRGKERIRGCSSLYHCFFYDSSTHIFSFTRLCFFCLYIEPCWRDLEGIPPHCLFEGTLDFYLFTLPITKAKVECCVGVRFLRNVDLLRLWKPS